MSTHAGTAGMVRALAFICALVVAAALVAAPVARAAITVPYEALGDEPVTDVMSREWGGAHAAAGLQEVHVLRVPHDADLAIETSLPGNKVNGRETVVDQARRESTEGHRVVAAINADVFTAWALDAAAPLGLTVTAGELMAAQTTARPAFGVLADGSFQIGTPTQSVQLQLPSGEVHQLSRVNQRRLADQLVLFTPSFDSHTWTDELGVEVILETEDLPLRPSGTYSAAVVEVRVGAGDAPIGPGQLVLSGAGAAGVPLVPLVPGDVVAITTSIDASWATVTQALGGPEILLDDGVTSGYSRRPPPVLNNPHPRTALGIADDGSLIAVVVDGRSSFSRGLTIAETAELMQSLGAEDAMSFDGGGSSTMAARLPGEVDVSVVNRLVDGVERAVSTSLQVVSSSPTSALAGLAVVPDSRGVYVGDLQQLTAGGFDAEYDGIALDQARAVWTSVGEAGSVSTAGILTADSVGQVEVGLTYSPGEGLPSLTADRTFSVEADGQPPLVTSPTLELLSNVFAEQSTTPARLSWSATDEVGRVTRVDVQMRSNGGLWKVLTTSPTTTALTRNLTFGRSYRFKVRARDDAGHMSAWALSPIYRIELLAAADPLVTHEGPRSTIPLTTALAGSFVRSDARLSPGASSISYRAIQAALVAVTGPKRGIGQVFVDGIAATSFNLYRARNKPRKVVYVTPVAESGGTASDHSLLVRNISGAKRPFVDLDSYLILTAVGTDEGT